MNLLIKDQGENIDIVNDSKGKKKRSCELESEMGFSYSTLNSLQLGQKFCMFQIRNEFRKRV